MIRRTSWILMVSLLACSAFARDEYTRVFDKTISLQPGQRVFLEHKFGDIIVRTHPQGEAVIHAVIHVSAGDSNEAKSYADRVEILVEPSQSELSIRTRYPDTSGHFLNFRNVSYSVHYELTLPEGAPLELHNAFGGVSIVGVKAGAQVVNSHGDLEVRDCRGAQHLENSFGSVRVTNDAGDVSIDNTNGSVDASDIGGALTIHDRFASINAARIAKDLTIVNNNGSVEVSDCGGAGSIKNSFGNVAAHNIRGDLIVNNANGAIEAGHVGGSAELNTSFSRIVFDHIGHQLSIRASNSRIEGDNVNGPASIKTSFGGVRVNDVAGLLTVRNQNGGVEVSRARGAQITTSFSSVALDSIDGPIQVENQNGSVEASSSTHGRCQPLIIHTSFSSIRVHLPPDASYNVFAKTSFAKIHTDFPMMVSGSDDLSNGELNGKIGGGACELRLTNNNGSIEILKSGS